MAQELQVVQCYSCEIFQTQIVKKSNKWACKTCGEKQSLKKVFGQGSGKDCRIHCQHLNALRATKGEEEKQRLLQLEDIQSPVNTEIQVAPSDLPVLIQSWHSRIDSEKIPEYHTGESQDNKSMSSQPGGSKWSKYLSQPSSSDEEDGEGENEGWNEVRPSQFCIPSTPESFEIASAKKYKNNSGQQIAVQTCDEFFKDSEDDCFNIDIPDDDELLQQDVSNSVNMKTQKINTNISSKGENTVKNSSKSNFTLNIDDLMDIVDNDLPPANHLPTSLIQGNIKNATNSINSKGNLNTSTLSGVPTLCQSKHKSNAVFKMVPSDNFVIEQLKKRISLLEDIDKYTLKELTDLCKFD